MAVEFWSMRRVSIVGRAFLILLIAIATILLPAAQAQEYNRKLLQLPPLSNETIYPTADIISTTVGEWMDTNCFEVIQYLATEPDLSILEKAMSYMLTLPTTKDFPLKVNTERLPTTGTGLLLLGANNASLDFMSEVTANLNEDLKSKRIMEWYVYGMLPNHLAIIQPGNREAMTLTGRMINITDTQLLIEGEDEPVNYTPGINCINTKGIRQTAVKVDVAMFPEVNGLEIGEDDYSSLVEDLTNSSTEDSGLSTAAVVGISVGIVAIVAGGASFIILKRKRSRGASSGDDDDMAKRLGPLYNNSNKNGDDTMWHSSINKLDSPEKFWSGSTAIPPAPWHEFVLDPDALVFDTDPVTGKRAFLGEGRYAKVYRAKLRNVEEVAVKCISIESESGSSAPTSLESSGTCATSTETSGSSGTQLPSTAKLRSDKEIIAAFKIQLTPFKELVLSEAALLKACRSKYIVNFVGLSFKENEVQLAMELMHGGNLWQALRSDPKSVGWYARGKRILQDIASGLAYLHAHRVVHLDVKSSNVLLEGDRAKLSDVGLSKIIPTSREYLQSSNGRGTWSWVSPEVILGMKCTSAADVWSFGVVIWEICTGEAPIRGQMRDVKVPEECPKEVAALMQRCWAVDPHERPTSGQIMEELAKC